MSPPYTPFWIVNDTAFWPPPYSLDPLPKDLRHGLVPVGILATLSVGATLTLISFICYRLVTWKMHYNSFLGYNQYVLLVLNLLIADLQQSAAFLFSFHWIRYGRILAPTAPCFGQAWLLHSGDVSSGFFVLAIAVHTFWTAVRGERIGHKTFAASVLFIWAFTYFLTGIGLHWHGDKYFVRAGAWCWISVAYETERLALHYIWVFLVQFGTVLIYVATFFMLRQKTRQLFEKVQQGHNANMTTILAINRITKLMTLYPCVYVLLTLPLSAGRMWSYAHGGKPYSNAYACVAGGMITSCGWVDSLLYTLTRRRLLKDTMPGGASRRPGDRGSMAITYTQTVTVEGGHKLESLDPKVHFNGALGSDFVHDRPQSRTDSTDPMLSSPTFSNGKAVGFRAMEEDDRLEEEREKEDEIADLPNKLPTVLPAGWVRHQPRDCRQ